jgi:hypothetical protein
MQDVGLIIMKLSEKERECIGERTIETIDRMRLMRLYNAMCEERVKNKVGECWCCFF